MLKLTFIEHIKVYVTLFIAVLFIFSLTSSVTANALSSELFQTLKSGIYFFDPNNECTANGSSYYSASASPGTGPYTWPASVSTPYYLEEYIVNVLEDIAQAENVPTTDTVTQEHVVAMTAWAYVEAGNIGNNSIFNIWNMGFMSNYTQLYVGGTGNSNGSQTSFASFDDGVEANTIAMTGAFQSRIGTILSQPQSTAEQVLHTIAYYDETTGNLAWSWGEDPTNPEAVLQYNHTTYINSLLSSLSAIRQNYDSEASVIIGPNEEGQSHVPFSDIQYNGGTPNPGSIPTTECGSSASANCTNNDTSVTGTAAILCEAEKYQGIYYLWGGGHDGYANFRTACPESAIAGAISASTVSDPGPCATDCSGLVSVAVDAVYNQTFDWTVLPSNGTMDNSSDWQSISISQAQPGDIVTFYTGSDGHVEIVSSLNGNEITTFGSHYTGSQTGFDTHPISFWNAGAWQYVGPGSQT